MNQADYSSAQACSSFALMNSAPAELLHLLGHAALQPSLATSQLQRYGRNDSQKNAGDNAGIGILFQKN
jgi:hypothetical protein